MTEQNEPEKGVPPSVAMLQMISGFWISRAIYIVAKLGLADHLRDGHKTADELAAVTGTHAPSLYRVLRALASVGVFAEDAKRAFALTPLSETLCTDAPGSLRAFATVELGEEHYPAWGELLHSVKTGEIAFDHAFGMPVWKFFEQNPENAKTFNDAMTGMTLAVNDAVLNSYDLSSISKIVDVGGGHGSLIASILKANPQMKGVLFDAPSVAEGAQGRIEVEGIADRCEVVAGDFFQSVPGGGDAYILKWIIHDWDDERSNTILRNCHRAMTENGKLLLVEAVVPRGSEPHFSKFIDLNMLVMTGGRERTENEYRMLLETSGFKLTSIIPTESPMSVIEGERL
ncbi:MAG: acetylserotonin O-methyltransferase [Acidobacteriota bacterium]|nr:acetylserotonin O-methyltransferase [Acidobacteriota bacterium]